MLEADINSYILGLDNNIFNDNVYIGGDALTNNNSLYLLPSSHNEDLDQLT